MKTNILALICSFFLSLLLGLFAIPILRRIKVKQPILKYVNEHKEKNGTPTMGGLFFIVSAIVIFLCFGGGKSRIGFISVVICFAFMMVGFLDDFIKVKKRDNKGLKGYQKIIFQFAIALFSGLFCYINGITKFNLPFVSKSVELGLFTIFFVIFIFIAITNSVNLTDGIDGLASSVCITYLVFISLIIFKTASFSFIKEDEIISIVMLCSVMIGGLLGFLVFNFNKAKVFMGDTGSLALGGLIASVSIFTGNSFFIPIIGIMFVVSSISVIVQVVYFKKTKRRVFLMSPLHHHFQMKGVSEGKICYLYSLITAIAGCACLICYL